jgi:glycosyltransferase involved in cell wall biosynthesis
MHVGLDLLFLVPGQTGGRETYARELVPALRAAAPDLALTAFVNRETDRGIGHELDSSADIVRVPVRAENRGQWAVGQVLLLPALAARARVEVLHSLANFAPLKGPTPRVLTVHDLLFRRYPQRDSRVMQRGTEWLVSAAARRARRLIAVSEATRDDVVRELSIPGERIDVIPNGLGTSRRDPAPAPEVRRRHELDERPVLLTIASDLPHKNLAALIRAQSLIPRPERARLLVVGQGTDRGELPRLTGELGLLDDTRLLGPQPSGELEGLYGLAAGLIVPSLEEGFGLPVLEAMAREVPVACSDIPVLREVTAGAALYFDPYDPATIAAAMRQLAGDAQLAAGLRTRGLERSRAFSWSATAEATLASYRRALRI